MLYKHRSNLLILTVFFLLIAAASCKEKGYEIPKADISDISADDIHLIRFDQLLFAQQNSDHQPYLISLQNQYPDIFRSYTENYWGLVQTDSLKPLNVYDSLDALVVHNEWMRKLYDSVQLVFDDMDAIEKELQTAIRYFRYYFPDSSLPQFYTYIGPFVYWTMIDDKTLGVELDMYMGEHFGFYGNFENNMPQYIKTRCQPGYIVTNIMETLMDGNIPGMGSEATLLDEMIAEGKMLYYVDLVMPDTPDSIKMGYTAEQMEWCYANESEIWKFLAGEELLFTKKTDHFRKYLGEAPTSAGMPEDAPGRVAAWVGWQIVRAYMKENDGKSLESLFYEMDAMQMLKESGYGPES